MRICRWSGRRTWCAAWPNSRCRPSTSPFLPAHRPRSLCTRASARTIILTRTPQFLPAPVHGDLHIGFDVHKVQSHSGMRLVIQPSSQDSKIQFTAASGTGLDAVEQSRIAAEIRKVIREGLTQIPVDLPSNFPFADFKGLGSGANQVIALPFQLSGAPPAGGPQSLTQSFIGSSGFAFAVSQEYVSGLIDMAAIREAIKSRSV